MTVLIPLLERSRALWLNTWVLQSVKPELKPIQLYKFRKSLAFVNLSSLAYKMGMRICVTKRYGDNYTGYKEVRLRDLHTVDSDQ